jgi:hypothetical protein
MTPLQSRKPTINNSPITKQQSASVPVETPAPGAQSIAVRAYELWQERGSPDGSPEADWHRAEHEIRAAGESQARAQASSPLTQSEPRGSGAAN